MDTTEDFIYIETPEQLLNVCERLARSDWLALDTEFIRERTYYPVLCLLQAGNAELTACIDPLKLSKPGDLTPLFELLDAPRITKVFHASYQDLEILARLHGKPPSPLFDTQLAAPLLGYASQAAYATLVKELLGIELDKAHTRTDWAQRPLTQQQLEYAADDVRYLGPLYLKLRESLAQCGRLDWLDDDFAALSDPGRYQNPPQQAWRRIKTARRLRGPQLSVLQALAAWREQTAQAKDRPRNWLIKDEVLTDIARRLPETDDQLATIRGINESSLHQYGGTLLAIVHQARSEPAPMARSVAITTRPDLGQQAMIDMLMAAVTVRARETDMHPAMLATRKDIEQLVLGNRDIALMTGWRYKIAGRIVAAVLSGECSLSIRNGKPALSPG